ncbi:MAG: hypothetical protein HYV07_02795 [Deltaproteobacteria bacterium]|nr:hypothetical protein [Deltaproteobacteria bacterium]
MVLASACNPRALKLELAAGDLLIFVAVDEKGHPGEPTMVEAIGSPDTAVTKGGADDSLFAFVIPRGSIAFRSPEQVLPRVMLTSETSSEGCGRCLVPSTTPPFSIFSGDVCPIPDWAPAGSDPGASAEALANVREALRLVSPGPCACPLPELERKPEVLSAKLLSPTPESEARLFRHSAALTDGTVAFFGRSQAISKAPGRDWERLDADGSFTGHVLSVAGTGRHFAVARRGEDLGSSRLDLFTSDLRSVPAKLTGLGTVDKVVRSSLTPGRFFVAGAVATADSKPPASLLVCDADPFLCKDIGPKGFDGFPFLDVLELSSGKLVAIFQSVGFVIYERAPAPSTVRSVEADRVRTDEGDVLVARSPFDSSPFGTRVGATADRLVACRKTTNPNRIEVVTASIAALEPATFRLLTVGPNHTCHGISAPLEDGSLDVFYFDRVARVSRSGELLSDELVASRYPDLAGGVYSIERDGTATFVFDAAGRVLMRQASPLFREVYGIPPEVPREGTLVTHRGEGWVVASDARFRISPGGLERLPGGTGEPTGLVTSDGERILAMTSSGVMALDMDTGDRELILEASAIPESVRSSLQRMVGTEPEVAIVLSDPPLAIGRISRAGFSPGVIRWDDLLTAAPEDAPDELYSITDARVSEGVAWFTFRGFERPGGAIRVVSWADPPLGERIALREEVVEALASVCPDRAYVVEQRTTDRAPLVVTELRVRGAGRFEQVELQEAQVGRLDGSYVLAAELSDGRLRVVSSPAPGQQTIDQFPAGGRVELDGLASATASAGGVMWVLAEAGRVFRVSGE